MSLENIINEIDSNTETQKNQINKEYEGKIKEVTENCNKKIDEFKKEYETKQEYNKNNIIKQYEDNIKLKTKNIIDNKKKELLNDALAKARSYIVSLNKSVRYKEIITEMLKTFERELGSDFIVYCNESEKEKIIEYGKLKPENIVIDNSIRLGIKASSKDKKKFIDFTLTSILDQISDKLAIYFYNNIE